MPLRLLRAAATAATAAAAWAWAEAEALAWVEAAPTKARAAEAVWAAAAGPDMTASLWEGEAAWAVWGPSLAAPAAP
ncbi:hypothetical protein AGMMS50256_24020 [Betaproteobacteria bacterium]|nr:hypothetical protein AGMMS50256_24020 [Betaproteobacteria bacterium]